MREHENTGLRKTEEYGILGENTVVVICCFCQSRSAKVCTFTAGFLGVIEYFTFPEFKLPFRNHVIVISLFIFTIISSSSEGMLLNSTSKFVMYLLKISTRFIKRLNILMFF